MVRSPAENFLRLRLCRASHCGAIFFVCKHCDRGQRYCSQKCCEAGRQQRCEANRRYLRTEPGRLAPLYRQRPYRQKNSGVSVMDHGSGSLGRTGRNPYLAPPRCAICDQEIRWIDPLDQISPRRWKQLIKKWVSETSKTTYFHDLLIVSVHSKGKDTISK
jgi:hypothetical protein